MMLHAHDTSFHPLYGVDVEGMPHVGDTGSKRGAAEHSSHAESTEGESYRGLCSLL